MRPFANPPLLSSAPGDGQVPTWDDASGTWQPRSPSGSGGAVAPSYLTVLSVGFSAPQTTTVVSGFTVEAGQAAGDDLALNADGIHVDVATPGIYMIQMLASYNVNPAGTTAGRLSVNPVWAPEIATWVGYDTGEAMVALTGGAVNTVAATRVYRLLTGAGQFETLVTALGGSAPDDVDVYLDILRIA